MERCARAAAQSACLSAIHAGCDLLGPAIAAGHLHDAAAGEAAVKTFDQILDASKKGPNLTLPIT